MPVQALVLVHLAVLQMRASRPPTATQMRQRRQAMLAVQQAMTMVQQAMTTVQLVIHQILLRHVGLHGWRRRPTTSPCACVYKRNYHGNTVSHVRLTPHNACTN